LRDHLKHSQEQHTKRNDTAAKVLIADHASQHQSRLEDKKLSHDKSKPKEQPKTESKSSPVNVKVDLHIDNQKGKVTKHIEFNGKTGTVVEEAR
jgi:ribosomal protein L21E